MIFLEKAPKSPKFTNFPENQIFREKACFFQEPNHIGTDAVAARGSSLLMYIYERKSKNSGENKHLN